MANRYGEAALIAARMQESHGKALTAAERWDAAVKQVYPTSPAGQQKGAPRVTFLGLAEAGLAKGVRVGGMSDGTAKGATASSKGKDYACEAVRLLKAGTHKTVSELWSAVSDDPEKAHNSQMDVVLALWKNDLIVR